MSAQIEVVVGPKGETEVSVKGHAGPGCIKLTEGLEGALGGVEAKKKTREFQEQENKNQARLRQ